MSSSFIIEIQHFEDDMNAAASERSKFKEKPMLRERGLHAAPPASSGHTALAENDNDALLDPFRLPLQRDQVMQTGCVQAPQTDDLHSLHGLTTLVRMVGVGWFSYSLYSKLYELSKKCKARVNRHLFDQIEEFSQAFLKRVSQDSDAWNATLNHNLSQLRQVRLLMAGEFQPLSEEDAQTCLWNWATTYMFAAEQLRQPMRKQRSIFRGIIVREFGCPQRMRAVVQRGLQDFTGHEARTDLLQAFISYVLQIETTRTARKLQDASQRGDGDVGPMRDTRRGLHRSGQCNPQDLPQCQMEVDCVLPPQGACKPPRPTSYTKIEMSQGVCTPRPHAQAKATTIKASRGKAPLIRAWRGDTCWKRDGTGHRLNQHRFRCTASKRKRVWSGPIRPTQRHRQYHNDEDDKIHESHYEDEENEPLEEFPANDQNNLDARHPYVDMDLCAEVDLPRERLARLTPRNNMQL